MSGFEVRSLLLAFILPQMDLKTTTIPLQKLHHDGLSASEIARRLDMDRKIVKKHLSQAPTREERQPKGWKVDPRRSYLRERWEQGVESASRLFAEIQKRGYDGCATQVKKVLRPIGQCAVRT